MPGCVAFVGGQSLRANHAEMAGNSKVLFMVLRRLSQLRPRPLPLLADSAGRPDDDVFQQAETLRRYFAALM